MTTQSAFSSEQPIINIFSLDCILQLKSPDDYRSLTRAQDQEGHRARPEIDNSPQSPASKDRTRRRMSFQRLRSSKKSGTVLRAVPETTECGSALLADERDMATSTHRAKSCKSASSSPALSSISEHEDSKGWTKTTAGPSTHTDGGLRTASSIASLKGAIGTYKHGRIQWRLKDKHGLSVVKSLKPKIHVVIPGGAQDRAQPTVPDSGHPSNAQVRSASAELELAYDISPPTGTAKVMMRDSIVSPLNHPPAVPLAQLHLSTPTTPTYHKSSRHRQNNSTSTTSSVSSQESDAFSLHSTHSSASSVEEDGLRMVPKAMDEGPVVDTDYGPPPAIPPRRYAPCSATKHATFKPTCAIRPTRGSTNSIVRRPTIHRKPSSSSSYRRSIDSIPSIGAINQAISRSESKKSISERGASPTLSEAENELQRSLTTFSEDTFLGRLADNDKVSQFSRPEKERNQHPWRKHMTRPSAEPAPLLPRKSSKRQSVINAELFRLSRVPNDHIASQITRGRSLRREQRLSVQIPSLSLGPSEESESTAISTSVRGPRIISPADAEIVLHKILQRVGHLDDLFALAYVSSGFYKVFKRNELDLIQSTLLRMSPAAWEFREYAYPGHDLLHDEDLEMARPFEEYTPTSYLHLHKHDVRVLREIKVLIHEKCQSFVRAEISAALIDDSSPSATRVDDALWRIWTFCKIFGSGKERDDDVVAQQDWLRGGVQAHQPACTFSVVSTDFMNESLIGAPNCFAKGNEGGLSAEQLFDMMELWNCLGVLLQGFQTRTAEARKYGIYDDTEIRGGDIDGEEMMLDEWCHHLLSFGLATVLDLARPCYENNGSAFTLAESSGLTKWKAPVHGGSKRSFLKEATSRVYEDKLAHVYAESSTRELQRQMSKQRIQRHIQDLKHCRSNGQQLRMIRQSQDRPMSEWENVMSSLTRVHPPLPENNLTSHIPSFRPTSAIAQEISSHVSELPATELTTRSHLPPLLTQSVSQRITAQPLLPTPSSSSVSGSHTSPRRIVAQPLLPTPTASIVSATRDRTSIATSAMPSIIEHPIYLSQSPHQMPYPDHPAFRNHRSHPIRKETDISLSSHGSSDSERYPVAPSQLHPVFLQHPAQVDIFDSPAHENTAEKAIYRIVEMGFTAEQARDALRVTDAGDGLRVDRAVELLLSRQM